MPRERIPQPARARRVGVADVGTGAELVVEQRPPPRERELRPRRHTGREIELRDRPSEIRYGEMLGGPDRPGPQRGRGRSGRGGHAIPGDERSDPGARANQPVRGEPLVGRDHGRPRHRQPLGELTRRRQHRSSGQDVGPDALVQLRVDLLGQPALLPQMQMQIHTSILTTGQLTTNRRCSALPFPHGDPEESFRVDQMVVAVLTGFQLDPHDLAGEGGAAGHRSNGPTGLVSQTGTS